MMDSRIGITLKEVGGASTSGGLEAESQEFFAPCLSEAILKRSAPESKRPLSQLLIPNIQHSIVPLGLTRAQRSFFRFSEALYTTCDNIEGGVKENKEFV